MMVVQLPTVEGEKPERDELLFFSPVLLFFCSFLLFSRQLKSSPLCSSTLFSKQSLFLSQTILCFLLSIWFSSSSSFPKILPPLVSFFSFSFLPYSVARSPIFIGSRGEVHHTLSKHRAWWRGMGLLLFVMLGACVSYFSINEGMGCVSS